MRLGPRLELELSDQAGKDYQRPKELVKKFELKATANAARPNDRTGTRHPITELMRHGCKTVSSSPIGIWGEIAWAYVRALKDFVVQG